MMASRVDIGPVWFFVILICAFLLGYIIGTTRDTRDGSPDDKPND